MWVAIGVTALFAGVCGIYADGWGAILEAIFIIVLALMLILISSTVDYCKDKKFIQLQSLLKEETVTVIRGKEGASEKISVWKLVVGDVIMLTEGQRVPADCITIESADLEVDEHPERKLIAGKTEEDRAK